MFLNFFIACVMLCQVTPFGTAIVQIMVEFYGAISGTILVQYMV